ncbi:hypothetical protein, partial [Bradyrhizobium sp.]|uniref:hypothetical protein n=1 Tax=Bradyrhizobium sp. TaxID=376 RepID=UPI003C51791D
MGEFYDAIGGWRPIDVIEVAVDPGVAPSRPSCTDTAVSAIPAASGRPSLKLSRTTTMTCKRPTNRAFRIFLTREKVCPLTGKLRGAHDESF